MTSPQPRHPGGPTTALRQAIQTNLRCRIVATRYGVCNRHFEIEPSAGKCIRMVRLLTQNATGLLRWDARSLVFALLVLVADVFVATLAWYIVSPFVGQP